MTTAAASTVPESLYAYLAEPKKMLIDGAWVEAQSGKTFEVLNPATDKVIARVAEGEAPDIDIAVRAARRAFDSGPWSTMTASDRPLSRGGNR